MQRGRELDRIPLAGDVHVHRRRFGAQEMVMKRGDLDPVVEELLHHRVHLLAGEHEVAHDHGVVMHRLEGEP